jgi:CheY-like chemotaxis protein
MDQVGSNGQPGLSSVTVLIVDDQPTIREMLTEVLEKNGATVTAVDSAEVALTTLKELRPDVLLSDLQMPGKDGYWLIRQVRALEPERGGTTPAACLTGLTAPEDRAQVLRAGFQFHVPKPIEMSKLVGIVGILALKP